VRLHEARGAREVDAVSIGCGRTTIVETNLLERSIAEPTALVDVGGSRAALRLRPFQIVTLRVARDQGPAGRS